MRFILGLCAAIGVMVAFALFKLPYGPFVGAFAGMLVAVKMK